VIDLGEIERINSCGVRDWVNWLSKLDNNGTHSVLVECSPAIVAQINLVNNFTGNGVVKSFYVPYFCPECDEEKVLLVEATDMGPPPHEPPTCRCDECDLVMDFDDMPDSYFAFLSNQRKLAEAEKINGAMRDLGRGSEPEPAKSKLRSRTSQPNLSAGSKPSVPSLPSIQRTATPPQPILSPTGGRGFATPQSRPQLGAKLQTGPMAPVNHQSGQGGMGQLSAVAQTSPSQVNAMNMSSLSAMAQPSGSSSRPSNGFGFGAQAPSAAVTAPTRSNTLVFLLITILVAAIAVLAYLVLTK
jgi:hypothetical protein